MAAKRANGLVFLDTDHFFIRERLVQKLITEKAEGYEGKSESVYVTCCDFNSVELMAFCSKKANRFCVSAKVPCFAELEGAGLMESLREIYGDLILADPNEPYPKGTNYNVTVAVDLANLTEPAEDLVEKLANLGRHLYAAPFKRALTCLNEGTTDQFSPLTLHYRPSEQVFIVASPHVVQVIYSLAFVDKVDRELARVFTVEFAESGRQVQKAPGVNWYTVARQPDELADMPHEVDSNCIGYVVFAVSKNHINTPGKLERVCDLLVQFRSYLVYHIKCSKTDLHSMMRKTYANLIQVKERCTPKGKIQNIK